MKFTLTLVGMLSLATMAAQAQQLFTNGPIATGATSLSGVAAPAGTQWSELQNNTADKTISSTTLGVGANALGTTTTNEIADDFTVPTGQRWTVNGFSFFGYQTGGPATSPFTSLTVRVWNGEPGTPGAVVVFGDATNDRLTASTDAMTYRIGNSAFPTPGSTPGTTRKIWEVQATFAPAIILQPGTYWVAWSSTIISGGAHFYVPVTTVGVRMQAGANAIQGATAVFTPPAPAPPTAWSPLVDNGTGGAAPPDPNPNRINQAMAFRVFGVSTPLATRVGQAGADGLSLRVWPVPASETAQVAVANAKGNTELRLSDLAGRLVWTGAVPAGTTEAAVPISALGAGVYLLEARTATGSVRASIVKK